VRLNLNADLGESFGAWTMGDDANLLPVVNTANVACGLHAGDPNVMSQTLLLAKQHGVSVGAHPGFADLQGFGRRAIQLPEPEVRALVLYQLSAIAGMARTLGHVITHVKPHGAINNMACEDRSLADIIVEAVHDFDDSLIFLAPVLSQLVSRRLEGAVLQSSEDCIAHVRRMIAAGGLVTQSGKVLNTAFHSICVHGDNAHAVQTAKDIKRALLNDGHSLCTLPELLTGQ